MPNRSGSAAAAGVGLGAGAGDGLAGAGDGVAGVVVGCAEEIMENEATKVRTAKITNSLLINVNNTSLISC